MPSDTSATESYLPTSEAHLRQPAQSPQVSTTERRRRTMTIHPTLGVIADHEGVAKNQSMKQKTPLAAGSSEVPMNPLARMMASLLGGR